MENVVISGIKILACKDQIRLVEVAEIYKAISYSKTGNTLVDNYLKIMLSEFFKYISRYGNIISVTSIEQLINNFGDATGMTGWIGVKVIKNTNFKYTEDMVNFKIYEFVYSKMWAMYLKALKESIKNNQKTFLFRFNIPKENIENLYENESNSLYRFKKEVFEILEVNGFLYCNGVDNGDTYTIEIS